MREKTSRNPLLLALILFYSLAVMCWALMQNPLTPNEARGIYMGRALLTDGIPACNGLSAPGTTRPIEQLMCAYPGSVAIAPLATAMADSFTGLYGARCIGVLLCFGLIVIIYLTGNIPFHGRRGPLAAAAFVFLGIPLQLSSVSTADALAAFFLGASFWLIEKSASDRTARERAFMLLAGALSLSLAMMTKYIMILLVASVALYVFLRHRRVIAGIFFLLPLLAVLSLYGYVAVVPAWPILGKSLRISLASIQGSPSSQFEYIYEWLALPYLLATFGIFDKEKGKNVFFLMLLSSPSFLVFFISPDISSIHSAAFFPLIFLAPAVAIGIEHMGNLFSAYNPASFVKPLFVGAVLVVILIFGLQQIKKLKRDYPDLSSAVTFFQGKAASGLTVLVDSDYGNPEYVYRYFLESVNPPARVVPVVDGSEEKRGEVLAKTDPDYIVLDDYHSDRSFNRASLEYLARGFRMVKTFQMTHASGIKNIRIFQKGAL